MFVEGHIHYNSDTQYRFGITYLRTTGLVAVVSWVYVGVVALGLGETKNNFRFSFVIFFLFNTVLSNLLALIPFIYLKSFTK